MHLWTTGTDTRRCIRICMWCIAFLIPEAFVAWVYSIGSFGVEELLDEKTTNALFNQKSSDIDTIKPKSDILLVQFLPAQVSKEFRS